MFFMAHSAFSVLALCRQRLAVASVPLVRVLQLRAATLRNYACQTLKESMGTVTHTHTHRKQIHTHITLRVLGSPNPYTTNKKKGCIINSARPFVPPSTPPITWRKATPYTLHFWGGFHCGPPLTWRVNLPG